MQIGLNLRKFCLSFLTLVISLVSFGQKSTFQYYTELFKTTEFVIEGKVLSSESYWDSQQRNIYTTYTIEVENVLKGSVEKRINLLVKGGQVDQTWQLLIPSVEFQIGESGVFLINRAGDGLKESSKSNQFVLAGGNRGFLASPDSKASLVSLDQSEDAAFDALETISGNSLQHHFEPLDLKSATATQVIDTIFPDVLTAGTTDILTIKGSGFGNVKDSSKVWFIFSDRPEFIFSNEVFKYITWTDSMIQLYVPFKAASGKIGVEVGGKKVNSSQSLTIRYACTNSSRTNNPVYLINANGQGGYSWHLHSNLNMYTPAKDIITQSINKWICSTSVPWTVGGDVKSVEGKDGESTISFGSVTNSVDEMGQTSLFISNHPVDGKDVWVLEEIDITLSDANEWCFTGECEGSDKYDFKTVVMHQLAHALLIDHVNNPADLMHYRLGKGNIRDVNTDNIECAEYNLNQSAELNHPDFMTINPYQFEPPVVNRNEDTLSTSYIFNSYQWYDADGLIPGATESVYIALKTGEYYLEGINQFGCSQISDVVEVFILDNNATPGEVLLYPNPTHDELHIESAVPFTEAIFFNVLGQKMLHVQLAPESLQTTFHLSGLPAGVYSVVLLNSEEKVKRKFVVY